MSELRAKLISRARRLALVIFVLIIGTTLYQFHQSYALVQTWDLSNSNDYTCEGGACPSTNIEVTGGYAQLKFKVPDFDDDTQGEFGCTGGSGDECSNQSGEGIAIWDTDHVGIHPYTVANQSTAVNSSVLRVPADSTDYVNDFIMVHFDSDESLSSEQVFLDVAEGSFAGAVYSDDIARGDGGTASEGDDPTVINSSVGPGFEQALEFDGGDRADLDYSGSSTNRAVNTSFDTNWGEHTYSVWFKTPDIQTRHLIFKEGGWVNGSAIYVDKGKVNCGIWTNSGDSSGDMQLRAEAPIKADTWHHVMCAHDSGAANNNCNDGHYHMYLDGELVEDASCTEFPPANAIENQNNHSGNDSICENDGDYFYNGGQHAGDDWCVAGFELDEYIGWNDVRTVTDAQALYGVDDPWLGIWHLEDASGTITEAGNWPHDSTSESNITYAQTGQISNGISLAGNGYFEIASTASLEFRDILTLMAWINPSALPADGTTDFLFDLNGTTDVQFGLRGSGGSTYLYGTTDDGTNSDTQQGIKTISTSTWQHVAMVIDGVTVRLYLNGILDSVHEYTADLTTPSAATVLRVGNDGGGSNGFNGTLDEPVLMKRAATAEEIAEAAGAHPHIAIMESPVKDAGSSMAWRRMTWSEDVRYGDDIDATDSNLQYLWHMDETDDLDTTLSPEVGGIDLQTLGTTKIHEGPFSKARYFNEDASILQSASSISAMTDYTIEMWVRFEKDQPLANESIFNVLGRDPAMRREPDGDIVVIVDNNEATPAITSDYPIVDRRWHHLAVTYDDTGGTLTLYIDGVAAGSGSGTTSSSGTFYAGDDGSNPPAPFDGAIDEIAIYDADLSAATLLEHYRRGKNQLKFLARSCDDSACSGESWEGPDGNAMLTAPTSGVNHAALWLFDEASYDGTLAEVVDETANNNDGRSLYAPTVQGGLFGRALVTNGKSAYVRVPNTTTLEIDPQADDITIEAWLFMEEGQEDGATVVSKYYFDSAGTGTPTTASYAMAITEDGRLRMRIGDTDETVEITSTTPGLVTVGEWVHVVVEFDGAFVNFFINGVADGVTSLSKLVAYDYGDLFIGYDYSDTYPGFKGRIDSLAIYDALLGESAALANFNKGNPNNYFEDGQGQNFSNIGNNQYFQYKAFFYSEGELDVELQDVGILNNFYSTADPAIEIQSAVRLEYVDLSDFTETLGPSNAGSMRYVLQEEGEGNWKYWDGANWVNSNSTWAQANDAATIDTNIAQFEDDVSCGGPCYVLWKGLMRSDGVQQVQLDTISMEAPNKVTVTAPISATMTVSQTADVTWTLLGDVTNVDIAYTTNGAQYYDLVLGADAEAGTGCSDPGARAGCYQITVPDAISSTFQIRVRETGDATVTNLGGNNTVQGDMAIVYPTTGGGETVIVGDKLTIQWIASGSIDNIADTLIEIDTQYSGSNMSNPGLTQITATARNDNNGFACVPPSVSSFQYGGCYEFTVPDEITSAADARIRVTDGSHTQTSGDFTITGSLAMLTPIASNIWKVETPDDISDNTLVVSWTNAGSVGSLTLHLDDTGAFTGNERQVKTGLVRNTNNGTSCTVPSGGGCVVLTTGEFPQADETTGGAASAKFRLTAATPNPNVVSSVASAPAFEIRPWYEITSPTSADTWLVGETSRTVVWNTHGNGLGNYDVHYRVDTGSWQAIGTNISTNTDDGDSISLAWNPIPNETCSGPPSGCDKMKVRIQQSGGGIEDQTDNFTIKPTVTITDPASKDFEIGSTNRSIAWTLSGTVPGNINIFYSTDQNWGNSCVSSTGAGKCSVCSALATALSCTWNGVPDTPSETVAFRAESADDPTEVFDNTGTTDNVVHGSFTTSVPVCSPNCFSEDEAILTWSEDTGSVNIPQVNIYYAVDGATWTLINSSPTPNDGLFNSSDSGQGGPFIIPEAVVHDNVQIRVLDSQQISTHSAGVSSAFGTPVKLRMINPNGGDSLTVGTAYDIEWAFQGQLSNTGIDLEYCADGDTCASPVSIAAGLNPTTNNGSGCVDPTVSAPEEAGCYRWADGATSGVANLRGTTFRIRVSDADVTGSVADCTPSNCATARPDTPDLSDADFKIKPDLILTYPTASGIKLDAQTSYNVTWTSQGSPLANVDLVYSPNGGLSYPFDVPSGGNPVTNLTGNTATANSEGFTTPVFISTSSIKFKVKVQDPDTTNFGDAEDDSDNTFEVVARFDPTTPSGGEFWPVLTNQLLQWNSFGAVSTVQIEYYNNAIGNWTTIIQEIATQGESTTDASGNLGNAGQFTWKVPDVANIIDNNTTKIRLIDAVSGHVLRDTPVESNTFNVVPNFQIIEPPESGVNWRNAQTRVIRWKQVGNTDLVSNVHIEYDAVSSSFANAVTIKTNGTNGTNADNGGCTLDGGLQSHETEGCFAWVISGFSADDTSVWVRVRDADAGHPASESATGNGLSSQFTVYQGSTLTVQAPAAQTYDVDDDVDVIWSGTGDISSDTSETIDIYYTTASSPTYPSDYTIWSSGVDADSDTGGCSSGAHLGCIRLKAPDAISTQFAFYIVDADDDGVNAASSTNTVNGNISINSPAQTGPETYVVGDTMTITWTVFGGSIGQANDTVIEIDTDYAGSNYTNPGFTSITTTAQNNNNGFSCVPPVVTAPQYGGCYEFTIPDELTNAANARVRVRELAGPYTSESDDFTVTGRLTLTKPTGTDVWKAESALDTADNSIFVAWDFRSANMGTLNLDFDPTGDFTGVDLVTDVKTGLVHNTNNGTSCTAGAGGCVVLTSGEYPDADDLTGGAATAKFRLRATTPNPDVESASGSTPAFEVRGWYDVTTPSSGTTWSVGASENIVWDTHGNGLGNIDIQYKIDAGSWVSIANNVADVDGDGNTYNWSSIVDADCNPLPLGCDKVKVRIRQAGGGGLNILDESDNFTVKPGLNIQLPSPTNFRIADTTREISWTVGGTIFSNANVYYSTDGNWGNACQSSTGTGKCSVCSALAVATKCTWSSVPDTPSETVLFRVEAAEDSTINSATSSNSSLHGNFTMNAPACAPNCFSEDTTNLTWTETTGSVNIANVDLYYRTSGGSWTQLNAAPTPNDGIFNSSDSDANAPWTIPANLIHDSVEVRVVDANDTLLDSAGDSSTFETRVKFRMITPNGGEELTVGTTYDIGWAFQGTLTNTGLNLKYCTDGTITCGSPGTIVSGIDPTTANGTGCTIPTVSAPESAGCYRWSDATSTGVADVRGTQIRVFAEDADTVCTPAACSSSRPSVDDGSDANVKAQVDLALVQPIAAGLKIDASTSYNVQWDSQGTPLGNVDILYSNNSGASFPFAVPASNPTSNTTQAAPPSSPNNTFAWTTPNTISTSSIKYQIRVRDPDTTNYPNAFSDSGNSFDLVARFDPSAPAGGESWRVLTNQTLSWSTAGTVSQVQIQYYNNAIASWTTIIQDSPTQGETATAADGKVSNGGTFLWKVPNVANIIDNNTTKIRLLDADTGHILRDTPVESSTFNVVANLAVTQPPESGVIWRATQTRIIHWKLVGDNDNLTNVTLEYSADGDADPNTFDSPQNIATGINHGTNSDNGGCSLNSVGANETAGCFAWVIPGALANDTSVYVRVKDNESGHPDSTAVVGNGVSSVFSVLPNSTITVQAPVGQTYDVDDAVDVQWDGTVAITDPGELVDIYYDIGGGPVLWANDVDADAATGGCSITHLGCARLSIPDAISAAFQVRVEDADDSDIFNQGGNNTVNGKIEIQTPQPTGPETFIVGDTLTISWISFGTVGAANDTQIEIDTQYAGSNYANPGLTTITTTATNDNNGFGCVPPSVSAPQFGGCYEFTLPDEITTAADARVRVTEGSDNSESDLFTVTGSITLTKPTALDVWKTETALDIADNPIFVEWNYMGTLGTMSLDFDPTGDFTGVDLRSGIKTGIVTNTNNGTSCVAPSGGGCVVLAGAELPDADDLTSGATAKFRLTAATPDPDVVSVVGSTPAFEVRGWYNVTAPTGADTWLVQETSRNITWETHGNGMGNVTLSYKVDTGSWIDIITNLSDSDGDSNNYNWPSIPDAVCGGTLGCDKVKVRVMQSVGSISDESVDFTIKPRVNITNPSPTNFQIADTTRTLAWTLNGTVSGNVNIYYSTDQNWGNSCIASTGTGKCSVCSASGASLSCSWASVPDTASETVVFRAEAADDTTINSITTGNASIHGAFTANVPACSPNCYSEQTTNLTWSEDTGSVNIANVDIYYQVANGSWTKINTNPTPNDGIFNSADTDASAPFVIPDTIVHDSVQIRVVDTNDTLLNSAGDSTAFSVPAQVRMITPNGSETWAIGDTQDIQWAYTGTIGNVSIRYCQDGTATCGSPDTIVASVAANNTAGCSAPTVSAPETGGCYSWADATTSGVANTRGTQMRAFVTDEDTACSPAACSSSRPKNPDASDANFKIIANLSMVAPAASAQLDAGTNYNIQWNSQGTPLTLVDLVLSSNGGSSYGTNIQLGESNTSLANTTTLNTKATQWTSPTLITDSGAGRDYYIRVRDPDTTNYVEAESNVNFDIVAKFTFTNPTSGSNLLVGRNYTLAWTTLGAVNNIQLAYQTPNIGSYQTITQTGGEGGTPVPTATDVNNEAPNTGTFTWQVPDVANVVSTAAELRIVDGDDTHVLRTTPDESSTFNILPAFEIINPVGSEILDAGETLNIQWKTLATNSAPGLANIDFSTNGGSTWTGTVVAGATNGQNSGCTLPSVGAGETAGCYEWKMPGTATSTNVKIRVKDGDSGAPDSTLVTDNGVSSAFQIQDAIVIISPATSEQVTVGTTYDIQWEVYGTFNNVNVQYSDDDFVSDLANIIMNATHDQNGSGCTLSSPAAGGTAGCYRWNPVPNDVRPGLKLRVKEATGAEREKVSGVWEIVGPLSLVSPNGGTSVAYDVDDIVTITWSNNPGLPRENSIDLEYSVNGGGAWNQVLDSGGSPAEAIDNSGGGPYTFNWEIPDNISDNVLVRIIRNNDSSVGDQSNDPFDITGKIELTTLGGGNAQYAIGDTVPIVFDVTGTLSGSLFNAVTVRYSTDSTFQTGVVNAITGFALDHNGTQTNCTGGAAPYTCTFNWTIADTHQIVGSEDYYLQVVDNNQLIGASASSNRFQLYGDLTLSAEHPCGVDNVCFISEAPSIVFTKEGNSNGSLFDFVNIQYSNDGFANHTVNVESNWALDATNCPAGTCTYTWNIDNSNVISSSNTYFLRVIDPDNTISVDTGTTGFEIAGNLALSILNGGGNQIYKVGDTVDIDFSKSGSANGTLFNDVVIQYSDQSDFSSNVVNIDTAFALNATNCPANACTKSWLIDDSNNISATEIYYLRVFDPDNPDSSTGASTDQFEIRGNLVLTILTAGNQTYKVGDNVSVTWEKDGAANGNLFNDVTIEYSDDSFSSNIINIANVDLSAACSGSFPSETCTYNWVLDNSDPIITTQNYTMRIIDPQNADSVTTSTRQFKVAGDLTLTILGGGDDTYDISENVNVTWTAEGAANNGAFDNIHLQYSNDNFSSNIVNIATNLGLSSACVGINCTHNWAVPSSAVITSTASYKFRVIDPDNPTDSVSTTSNRFRLAGYLNLTTQGSNATYAVGSAVPITFAYDGTPQGTLFNDIHIQYSNNEFGGDTRDIALNQVMASPVSPFACGGGSCTYTWTIPSSVTLTSGFDYRLRVIDPDNTNLTDYGISLSGGKFKLSGGFTWNAPTGASVWGVGSDQTADWNTSGNINNIKMSYSTNDFANETFFEIVSSKLQGGVVTSFASASPIANTANGNTVMTMVVPDAISTNFKIRIYDSNDSTVYVDTPALKVHAVYTVTEPGVNAKVANTVYTNGIQWSTAGTVANSILQYQLDGGSWTAVPAAESGSVTDANGVMAGDPGSINWTTPSAKAAATKVRVCTASGASPDTDSCTESSTFKLSAKVNVTAPNAENAPLWRVGQTTNDITWTTVPANLGNNVVDILYSTQGLGGVFSTIVSGTANDGTHTWNPIPDSVSDNVYIRVVDSNDADGKDESDAAFSIAGDLQIEAGNSDAPLGGELWPVYKSIPASLAISNDIIWTSTGTAMNQVDIRASNDGFTSSNVLIASGVVNVVGQNTYSWNISDSVAPITAIGNNWQIRIVNSASGTPAEEVTSGTFSIGAGMAMSSHNTLADRCIIGNVCTINWDTAGSVSDVILEYSDDSGSSWNLMHGGGTLGSNPGFINWSVPGGLLPQTDIRYRVTDGVGGHPLARDQTDIDTKVVAEFPAANILLNPGSQPLSGRTFSVGENITVDYTYTSTVANINVQYTLDNDSNPLTFDNPVTLLSNQATNGDGTGQFSYTFGDLMAGGADVSRIQFRVVDSAVPDDDVTNTVNGVTGAFKLRGDIVVTSPNTGTEKWPIGSSQSISWTHAGASITNVTIEYDDNVNFTSPTTLVSGTPSNATVGGTYNFTINNTNFPDINILYHNDIFIRVSDADTSIHGNSNDKSDNGHLIIGIIDFTQGTHSPTVGTNWSLGLPHTITWNTQGEITSVNIYYSNSGLFNDAILINTEITSGECTPGPTCTITPDADTSVSWTPPTSSTVGVNSRIFVVDADDNTTTQDPTYQVQGQSPVFNLHGSLSYTGTLLDGQKLKAGNVVNFTWDTFGDALNNIDIEYSQDADVNPGTFDNPQPVVMGYDNSTGGGGRGTYNWTVPTTFNDDTVYLRINPAGSTAGEDISGSFKIMPNIQLLAPVNATEWEVGATEDITWNIVGTVSNITLRYSINNGSTYPSGTPYEIVTLDPNSGGYALTGANARYNWTIPDTITQQGVMRIQLDDDPSGDADATMAGNFTIESLFILNSPVANNEYEVGGTFTGLNWDWSGTIPNIMMEISNTYDGVDPATFDAGAKCMDLSAPPCTGGLLIANGSGSGGTGYSPAPISVPDWISRPGDTEGEFPFHIRISDPNNTNTWSIAPTTATGFKIKTNLSLTAPVGAEDWFVGDSVHNITWSHTGTVSNVVLEYSTDNFVSNIYCVNGGTYPSCNSQTNANTYGWQIPDDETLVAYTCNTDTDPDTGDQIHPCMNTGVRVRVRDSADTAVLDGSAADFTARYVAKEWLLRDSVSGADLNSITMFDNSIHRIRAYGNQSVLGVVSPYTIWSPSGTNYSIGFSKTGYNDFTDSAQTTTLTDQFTAAGEHFKDEEQEVFMQSTVAHNDIVQTDISYTAGLNGANDSITFKVYYTRDGLNVVTTNQAQLRVYDTANTLVINQTSTTQNPANSGVYTFTISPSGLTTNAKYVARNIVTLASNTTLEGFRTFNLGETYNNQVTNDSAGKIDAVVGNLDAQLSVKFNEIDTAISDLETTITGKIGDTSSETLVETMDSTLTAIQDSLTDFRESSEDTINVMRDRIEEASIRLIIPSTIKLGETETLRLGTAANVSPTLTVLCPDGTNIFENLEMDETSTGIYGVDIKFSPQQFSCAAASAVTVIAQAIIPSNDPSDPAFTATAVGSIFLTTTDLDTIQGLAAAGLNAEKAAKDAKDAIKNLAKALAGSGNVHDAIDNLQSSVNRLPSLIEKSSDGATQMKASLEEVQNSLKVFLGNDGYDFRSVLKQEVGDGFKGLRNTMDRTLATTKVMKEIVTQKLGDGEEPIVQTFYEIGSVKLRVIAVNPSTDKKQKVPVKVYLPKEVIPDDIIEKGDLEVSYDSSRGLYFAYSDGVELAPQETRVFEVHIEDIWRIPEEELQKYSTQGSNVLEHLENSKYFDEAKVIVDSIDRRINEIRVKQNDELISREEHIGAYRVSLMTVDQIKRDIEVLEKMLLTAGGPPSAEFIKDAPKNDGKSLDRITAWKLILGIVGFLGVLGLVFYVGSIFLIKNRRKVKMTDDSELGGDDVAPMVSENLEEQGGSGPEVSEKPDEPDEPKEDAA